MKTSQNRPGFLFSSLMAMGLAFISLGAPTLSAQSPQSQTYFAEQIHLSARHLALSEKQESKQSRLVGSNGRVKYLDVLELNLDGEVAYALSSSFKNFYSKLPMDQAFVQIRPPHALNSRERQWAQEARQALGLPVDIKIFFIEEALDIRQMEKVSGVVETCTSTSTSRGHTFHQEALCIGQYRVDELADYVGEHLTVLLQTQDQESAYSCSYLTRMRHPRSCNLKTSEFIAEIRQDGLVLVRNYANEFKAGQEGQIFEDFPMRASAEEAE